MAVNDDGSMNADTGITVQGVTVVEPTVAEPLSPPEAAQWFADTAVTTSTSTAETVKLSGTLAPLRGGDYKVEVGFGWNHDSNQNDIQVWFRWDGADLTTFGSGVILQQEPKDSAGANVSGTASNQCHPAHRMFVVTETQDATPSFEVAFAPTNNGVESSLWDVFVIISPLG